MNIIYFVDNKLGGVTSLNYNLAARAFPGVKQTVIHIDQDEMEVSKANISFPVDKELYLKFSADDNTYHVLKRLHKLISVQPGALVLNYEYEMAMLDHYHLSQTTYQLVHDNYNLKLARKYGHVVDIFICHNSFIYQELLSMYPKRSADIFFLPHGVEIPINYQQHQIGNKPLQLLFLGRMTSRKGIFDLPVIDGMLKEKGIAVEWTCIGNGPELNSLKKKWHNDKVKFLAPATNTEVLEICAKKDVFVLPTKFEGSPVSLLETMSCGLVPVITKLRGGITDIVNKDIGFALPENDNHAFASAIAGLASDRALLKKLGENCRNKIIRDFNLIDTAKKYHDLFTKNATLYRKKKIHKIKVGARLDHPLIHTGITKTIRRVIKKII